MNVQQINRKPTTVRGRREFIKLAVAGAAGAGLLTTGDACTAADGETPFSLPKLPYAYDALEPVIDSQTMTIHHTKHHQGYVNNLNAAIGANPGLAGKAVEELLGDLGSLPESHRTAIQNNGGGHANHTFFWTLMCPASQSTSPTGDLASAISSKFGSFESMQEQFNAAALTRFGSGWAWLVMGDAGLEIMSTANQDSPISAGKTPILGIDVWEHAYYLKYQNRRADYVNAWWKVVNWDQAASNLRIA